jgi:voltage-gated potassium channel
MRLTTSGSRRTARPRFRIRYALVALGAAVLIGATGFHFIEGWPLADSIYATVQTVTTVGYGDITPQTFAGRVFASFFMFFGFGVVAYILTSTVQWIVQSELVATFGERRRQREMKKLQQHFIICGAGRVGSRIIRELEHAHVPFVVIETDALKVTELIERNVPVLVRDATLEETLHDAGVERARGLAACLPDDADNVYVVLTARDLNHELYIVARAVEEQAEAKLIRAGANRVVAPTIIGSHRMAQALIKPAVADFMDSFTGDNLDLRFEQLEVAPASPYAGKPLRSTNIRSELNIVIVAIRRREGAMEINPSGDALIEAGDILVAIGRTDALLEFNDFVLGITSRKSKVQSPKSEH